ncbi:hypothetical protein [Mycolicibacterium agri]|uniref:Uncharacterized protein n=1 Tax=Mycolicibacterium agri TaxID=36811 RepID=A0A7I9WC75_MYCAG|nr:hypothetical protein [Mycolicibacterium agri]GFG54908.1 hypothetical protein MAGR_63490 [Mycolicibacterium agri]
MEPTTYQICVRGRLTERLAAVLEGMTLNAGTADSVFSGEVRDQSQLFGLLDRVRDLGLELISVQPQIGTGLPRHNEQRARRPVNHIADFATDHPGDP